MACDLSFGGKTNDIMQNLTTSRDNILHFCTFGTVLIDERKNNAGLVPRRLDELRDQWHHD